MKPVEVLDPLTRPADLVETLADGAVRCKACAHRCLLKPGRRGICGVRFNRDGTLMVPHGYVAGVQVDPVEKNRSTTSCRAARCSPLACWAAIFTAVSARTGFPRRHCATRALTQRYTQLKG